MADRIGLSESVAMAIGGMVGGGIFAVLGVVAETARTLAWLAFVLAGAIALCAGYSALRLNDLVDSTGGPISYVRRFTGNETLAGMVGWTFVIGYVGTMALYAYAFGGYAAELLGMSDLLGVPLRPILSVLAIALFVGLNVAGAHASGHTEDVLVGLKILILLLFGLGGIRYGLGTHQLSAGIENVGVGPVIAAGVAFVAFEGWELLLFDQDSIREPKTTVRRAIYVSIVAATGLYVLVALVTTNLVSLSTIQESADTALAVAARPFLGALGFGLISVAALFSTGSALNATLFSASRLARTLVADDFLPDELRANADGEPTRALVVLGVLPAAFAALGSLDAISSFASLSFMMIFGGLSALAFTRRDSITSALVPGLGVLGTVGAILALLWHLVRTEFDVFVLVVALALVVILVETVYFERQPIESELHRLERLR